MVSGVPAFAPTARNAKRMPLFAIDVTQARIRSRTYDHAVALLAGRQDLCTDRSDSCSNVNSQRSVPAASKRRAQTRSSACARCRRSTAWPGPRSTRCVTSISNCSQASFLCSSVAQVHTRIVVDVTLEIPGLAEPAIGRLVSIPERRTPMLNDLQLVRGHYVAPGSTDQVLVSEAFARANKLDVGDRFGAVLHGRWKELSIAGVALSPGPGMCGTGLRHWRGRGVDRQQKARDLVAVGRVAQNVHATGAGTAVRDAVEHIGQRAGRTVVQEALRKGVDSQQ